MSRSLWAYAYLIVPAQPRNRLELLRGIVEGENSAAEGDARIWTGKLVLEERITNILIVSDSPEQNRGVNQRLEAELKRLEAEYFLTKPMTVPAPPEGMGGDGG